MIPKRIIQTGKTRQLKLLEQAALTNLKAVNPDFEYIYFRAIALDRFLKVFKMQTQNSIAADRPFAKKMLVRHDIVIGLVSCCLFFMRC